MYGSPVIAIDIKNDIICQMKNVIKMPAREAPADKSAVVLRKALVRTAVLLELGHAQLARILGVSDSSVHRLFAGQRTVDPESKEGELAALLIRLYRSLDAVVGADAELRRVWLNTYNHALNARPVDLLVTAAGLVYAVAYLDHARAPI